MFKNLLKVNTSSAQQLAPIRHHGQHNKKHIYKDGQKFANNFYYARYKKH